MPSWWFVVSIKFLAPLTLTGFFIWNLVSLFKAGGIYGAKKGYKPEDIVWEEKKRNN